VTRVGFPPVLLSAAAAAAAAAGYVAALSFNAMHSREMALRLFAAEATVAVAFALWPSGGHWSLRRRIAAGAVAAPATVLVPFVATGTSGGWMCSCAAPPVLFGVDAQGWVVIASVAFPVLIALTAVRLPQRGGRPA
jgi:hypothetical protein